MRKFIFFIVLGAGFIISCNNNEHQPQNTEEISSQAETVIDEKAPPPSGKFDLNNITVTTAQIGEFPYFTTPEQYKYTDEKTKAYEEKLFFYNDSLAHKIGGKYYHARIFPDESVPFEETYVVNNYKKAIEKLGGIEIYSGPLYATYNKVMKEDLPYLKDLYDPYAYKYKQFTIRTPDENIWIELIHGLNANMLDFTVIKEATVKETVSIIQADEIQEQLNNKGKAVLYINFDINKSTLLPDGQQLVDEIAKMLHNNTPLQLSIEGHTDNTGADVHNKKLSLQRAQAVLNNLTAKGIASSRLTAKGFGSEKPLAPNDSEENKRKNRRVELIKL